MPNTPPNPPPKKKWYLNNWLIASLDKIYRSAETISKLGTIMDISINGAYLDSKIKELRLAFEYQ